MTVLRSLVCLTASLLGACSSSEPTNTDARELERRAEPPIVEVEPKQPAAAVREGFGPAIGGSLVALSTVAGRYASEFRYTQDKLITMEHTISARHSGTIELVLGEDGSARLCQTAVDYSRGQVGRLATADGKTRTNEHNSERTFAMAGRWTQDSDGIALTLRFDRVAYDTCEVPKDQVGGNMMSELACFTTPSNTVLPSSALVCAVASDQHQLIDAALLLVDSPRAGSWALRFDPAARSREELSDAQPYLILGADPGLRIVSDDPRRSGPKLEFEATQVAKPKVIAPTTL